MLLQNQAFGRASRDAASWTARLDLDFNVPGFVRNPDVDVPQSLPKTRLDFRHEGPLRIQKALYPEGPSPCHAIIVHPPGGIAGGDRLEIKVASRASSHGLITTPSAAKWYGTDGDNPASQRLDVDLDGALEWLPQETIVFDRARVESEINIRASATGAMIGWDHLIFGRKASGESFDTGCFRQSLNMEVEGQVVWQDRLVLQGGDALFASPIGLRGHHAFATVWAVLPASATWTESVVEPLREAAGGIAWTVLHPRLMVGRVLADPARLKSHLHSAWHYLRPSVFGRPAVAPRLWAT